MRSSSSTCHQLLLRCWHSLVGLQPTGSGFRVLADKPWTHGRESERRHEQHRCVAVPGCASDERSWSLERFVRTWL